MLWFDDIGLSLVLTDDMDKIAAVFTELDKQVCGKAKPGLLDMPGVTPAQVGGFFEAAASRPQSKIEAKNCPHCSQVFLDSEEHHHDPRNIPVSVSETGNIRFKEMKIDDPANHFKGKVIRVTGVVTLKENQPQIEVDDPRQIEIVPLT